MRGRGNQLSRVLTVENVSSVRPRYRPRLTGAEEERDSSLSGQKARVKMRVAVDGQSISRCVREAGAGKVQLEGWDGDIADLDE